MRLFFVVVVLGGFLALFFVFVFCCCLVCCFVLFFVFLREGRAMTRPGMERQFSALELDISLLDHEVLEQLFVGCLTFQQHASVSQGRICSI